jgi:replicative superfamily II helicase
VVLAACDPNIDPDHVVSLSARALMKGQQVLVFCATKNICSQTSRIIAENINRFLPQNIVCNKVNNDCLGDSKKRKIGICNQETLSRFVISHHLGEYASKDVKSIEIVEKDLLAGRQNVITQIFPTSINNSSTGSIHNNPLDLSIRRGVAYHHAGLGSNERDIIETAFKKGILSILTGALYFSLFTE